MQLLYSHLQEQMKEIHTNYMVILHSDQDLNWGSPEYYKNRLVSIQGMRDERITEVLDVLPLFEHINKQPLLYPEVSAYSGLHYASHIHGTSLQIWHKNSNNFNRNTLLAILHRYICIFLITDK